MNITIKNEYLTVEISDFGAELQSIKSADGTEYLWQKDPEFWEEQAPNIFPYVARLTQGKYTADGASYEMKIHGFVKYMTLLVESHSEDSVTFRLDSNDETRAQYPYDFTYRMMYQLKGNEIVMTTQVNNTGKKRMYFALGGHPGFRVPLEEGLSFEDYTLTFDAPSHPYHVGFTPACFLNGQDVLYQLEEGRKIPLHHDLFDDDAVVLKHVAHQVRLESEKGKRAVTVTYPDFPYLGIWHKPKSTAPYVCIEPWSALPSRDGIIEELSQQADLNALNAGEQYAVSWKIAIE